MPDTAAQTTASHSFERLFSRLNTVGKTLYNHASVDDLFKVATDFVTNELGFEKCLVFRHDESIGTFKLHKASGYNDASERKALAPLALSYSNQLIQQLQKQRTPLLYTREQNSESSMAKLLQLLFLDEARLELFGGTDQNPFGLLVAGNGSKSDHAVNAEGIRLMVLDNLLLQLSHAINTMRAQDIWINQRQMFKESLFKHTRLLTAERKSIDALLQIANEGFFVLDQETTAFLDVNPAYCEMTGYSREELLKTNMLEFCIEKERKRSEAAIADVIENGVVQNFEKGCQTKNGVPIIIRMSMAHVREKKQILVAVKNITEHKALERNLRVAKEKAELATRTQSRFLANMSHEMRTPMNGIVGMAHLALQSGLNEQQRRFVKKIDDAARSLLEIVNDVLDFSKIEAGQLKITKAEFDLYSMVDRVVSLVAFRVYEKRLELIIDYDSNVGRYCYGDALRISQVLNHLLSNAVKFTEAGSIKISIAKTPRGTYRFKIRDTGIGMSSEHQAHLLQTFGAADESMTRKYGGIGLGLMISKRLVTLMEGTIWVESVLGKGSLFGFEVALESRVQRAEEKHAFGSKRVLIVDSSEVWRTIAKKMLGQFGIVADTASSSEEGREKVAFRQGYDLIMLDGEFLEGNAMEAIIRENLTCKQPVRSATSPLPGVIIMYAFAETYKPVVTDVGVIQTVLHKPLSPVVLYEVLSGIFSGTLVSGEYPKHTSQNTCERIRPIAGSRILLVEDNDTNREVVQGILKPCGMIVDEAHNGAEALERCADTSYDLILMDIRMPVMDGYEATRRIRNDDRITPIIALSANAMAEDVEKSIQAGMNMHLSKPVDVAALYAALLRFIQPKHDESEFAVNAATRQQLPEFVFIDTSIGLMHLGDNVELYHKILLDFAEGYREFYPERFDAKSQARLLHTIKGLSAGIGAMELHRDALNAEENPTEEMLEKVKASCGNVIREIDTKLVAEPEESDVVLPKLDEKKRTILLSALRDAAKSWRPKNCEPLIRELEGYALDPEDAAWFTKFKALIVSYKFKEAMELLP